MSGPAPSNRGTRRPTRRGLAGAVLLTLAASAAAAASRPAVPGRHGMVVSPEREASRIGAEVLEAGGNAIDAAVAVALALAVTYPQAGNLGGGGFMLYRAENRRYHALDFRETAPRKLRPELFLDEEGRPVPDRSLEGGLAIGVPGSVAGLAEAHRRWGSRPWSELVAPAIRLAEEGFSVSAVLARDLAKANERLSADPEARRIFTRDGAALAEGDRLIQKDLAASLRRVGSHGVAGLHGGPLAEAVVRAVAGHGGVMETTDLAEYRPVLREPLRGSYRGYTIVTFPPPSSGGVALLQMLGMLTAYDLEQSGFGSSLTVHRMTEVSRRAFADRSRWLGDPAFFDVPVRELLDTAYLGRRVAGIRSDRATPSRKLTPGDPVPPAERPNTLHFSITDEAGRAVSLTTTLNASFGAAIVAPGTGILLNNEMDDFALAPGVPNSYGLLGGEANAVAGGKRPLSSMTPTIVELPEPGPRPALVLGSPGGGAIITSVLQVLVNVIDHGMPLQAAVDAPRFHHQWMPDRIRAEPGAFPHDVERNLLARGHEIETVERLGNVNAIGLDDQGRWLGAADPRRAGAAVGY